MILVQLSDAKHLFLHRLCGLMGIADDQPKVNGSISCTKEQLLMGVQAALDETDTAAM
jgi:hypothetical protein